MPHRESRFTVNLVLVISERGGAYSAGFVRIPVFYPINREPSSEIRRTCGLSMKSTL